MKKSTEELLIQLQNTKNIEGFLADNRLELQDMGLMEYLKKCLSEKNLKVAQVMERSGQSDYVYKVFKNQRKASRNILIAIAVGMGMDVSQTQTLLRIAPAARLDPRNTRDAVLIYGIAKGMSVYEINDILYDMGEILL